METLISTSAVEPLIETQILERREQFALIYTRAMAWSLGILAVGMGGVWLISHYRAFCHAFVMGICYAIMVFASPLPRLFCCSRSEMGYYAHRLDEQKSSHPL